jgi:exodeoxyribonuclease-3
MKIISWNINSLRLRLPLLAEFVKHHNPDIVCLQETKVQDCDFPLDDVKKLGFEYVDFSGEKSYNGVAILSKIPFSQTKKIDVENYGQKRHISAKFGDFELHNFYVPAGGDIPDATLNEKFDHKLKFVDFMHDYFNKKKQENLIIVGDFNIAPLEHDVWSHKQLLKVVSHTPIEVEKLLKMQKAGNFIDCNRLFIAENEKLYSWWSYRGLDPMKSNRGRRLDHIWISGANKEKVKEAKIHVDFRVKERPSDHVPIEIIYSC